MHNGPQISNSLGANLTRADGRPLFHNLDSHSIANILRRDNRFVKRGRVMGAHGSLVVLWAANENNIEVIKLKESIENEK